MIIEVWNERPGSERWVNAYHTTKGFDRIRATLEDAGMDLTPGVKDAPGTGAAWSRSVHDALGELTLRHFPAFDGKRLDMVEDLGRFANAATLSCAYSNWVELVESPSVAPNDWYVARREYAAGRGFAYYAMCAGQPPAM